MVERKIVALKVVGSSPIVYPPGNDAVGSVSALGADCHVFESHFLVLGI